MSFTKVPLKTHHLTLWLYQLEGLLLNKQSSALVHLSPLAVAALFLLDDGHSKKQTTAALIAQSHCSRESIEACVHDVMRLIARQNNEHRNGVRYLDGVYPEIACFEQPRVPDGALEFEVANTRFAIVSNCPVFKRELQALFEPILVNNTSHSANNGKSATFLLSIEVSKQRYSLSSNQIMVERELSYQQIMPVLIDRIQILAYQHSDYYFGFHGAALTQLNADNKLVCTLLLPGASGAGKSTLAAALAADGAIVHSDEVIAFNKDLKLATLQLPIAIKSGSWSHLQALYPQLQNQTTWHRVDGRQLKYVWPRTSANNGINAEDKALKQSHKLHWLLPQFGQNSEIKAEPLSVIQAISMLTSGGYQLGKELDENMVNVLLDLLENASRWQLQFSHTKQAKQLIGDVTNAGEVFNG